ncbi:hypothetical protein [Jiangella alkaliphila]|uniref:Uncharacterized protein n=1 Tax=Jiangella alkaliphila TaxID=419479 RepID=A0A1H2I3S5_9ACTN|nr:hypothetical protein [Jiangella alkaliphila]SDU38556.1 hypothetical protein SAMN04488563_1408 [Jiangella alkaliphila]
MQRLLGGSASPAGWWVSYLEVPFERVVDAVWRGTVRRRRPWQQALPRYPDCLETVEPFTVPITRYLIIGCDGNWTALVDNNALGGEPSVAGPLEAAIPGVCRVTALHAPRHGPGHAGTQLRVSWHDGTPLQPYRRELCADCADGRWSWYEHGTPMPFERPELYEARMIKRRFNRDILVEYLAAMGIRADDDAFYGGPVAMVDLPRFGREVVRSRAEALAWLEVHD